MTANNEISGGEQIESTPAPSADADRRARTMQASPLPKAGVRPTPCRVIALAAVAAAAMVAQGCGGSGGLSYREDRNRGQTQYLSRIYQDQVVSGLTPDAKPQTLKRPAGVAVAQIGEVAPPEAMMTALRKESQLFSRVEAVPANFGSAPEYDYSQGRPVRSDEVGRQLTALRGMASTMGLDYLLLVGGTLDQSTDATAASALNLTIIGLFVVPGDETQALMKASGALIDVRTGQVVAIGSAEVDEKINTPRIGGEGRKLRLLKTMRDDVTTKLAQNMTRDLAARPVTQ